MTCVTRCNNVSKVIRVSDEAYQKLCNASESVKERVDELVLKDEGIGLDEGRVREIVREELQSMSSSW